MITSLPSTAFHKEIELSSLPKVSSSSKLDVVGTRFMVLLSRPHRQESSNWFSRYRQWPRSGGSLISREIMGVPLGDAVIKFSLLSHCHLLVSVQLLPR